MLLKDMFKLRHSSGILIACCYSWAKNGPQLSPVANLFGSKQHYKHATVHMFSASLLDHVFQKPADVLLVVTVETHVP